jgi:Protein of unknown function (DUF3040)
MTLSEQEQRTLHEIETGCCTDDPDFVRRLDFGAASRRRSRALWVARATVWIGWIVLVMGAATARGVLSIGTMLTCYGVVILAVGAGNRRRLRTPWIRSHPRPAADMNKPDGGPGSIPRSRRPLVVGLCLLIGIVTILAGLLVNMATDTPVQWVLLCYIAGFIVVCYAAFLWVRLSN